MTKNFTVYKASAGSGKTFNLARIFIEELIRLDDQSIDAHLKSIMAITFTHKAANEMKDRVLSFLERISNADPNDKKSSILIDDIARNIDLPKASVISRAGIALELIMENFSLLSISTIDSFSHRIVRSFSKELNLHFDFDVSLDYKSLIELAIDRLFDRFGSDSEDSKVLSATLISFFISQFEQGSNWNLNWLVKDFAYKNFNDELQDTFEKYPKLNSFHLDDAVLKLKEPLDRFKETSIAIASEAMQIIKNAGLTVDDLYYKKTGVFGFFDAASKGEKLFDLPKDRINKTLNEDKWLASKVDADAKSNFLDVKDKLNHLLSELIENKINNQDLKVSELLLGQIHFMALVSFIVKELTLIREEENVLLISDFNRLIDGVVKNEPVPFIYEKLGERYRHFLLDEFQDTSIKQWHNFVPLIDNAIAGNNRNLIVGDGKQAIYRFREGEVELFTDLPKIYRSEGELFELYEKNLSREIQRITLENNYRSSKEVVEFNNDFFTNVQITLAGFANVYDGHKQRAIKNEGGYVKFEILDHKELEEEDLYLGKVLESINECIEDDYTLSDIAILSRKKKHLSALASYLSEKGIDIVSDESLSLKNHEDISLIIAVMRYLVHGEDIQTRYSLFRALIFKYEAKALEDLHSIKSRIIPLEEKMKKLGFGLNRNFLRSLSLLELAREIESIFSLGMTLSAYYTTLLDVIEDYVRNNGNQLDGFISFWDDLDPSISTPSSNNAVQLLTIHKSKGLEYPVVIFPYLDWMKSMTNNFHWVDSPESIKEELPKFLLKLTTGLNDTSLQKNYEEEKSKSLLDDINLIYVAFTRAMERLYVFSSDRGGSNYITNEVLTAIKGMDGAEGSSILERGRRMKVKDRETEAIAEYFALDPELTFSRNQNLKIAFEFKKYQSKENEKALDYGKSVHQLFASINTSDDIEPALDLALKNGLFSDVELVEIREKIKRILKLDGVGAWFSDEGDKYLEKELVNDEGKLLRPDRIVIQDEILSIIDYKTGNLDEKKLQEYKAQVANYIHALQAMGYSNIKGYLLAIDEERVIAV